VEIQEYFFATCDSGKNVQPLLVGAVLKNTLL